jgi:hypothetical protein
MMGRVLDARIVIGSDLCENRYGFLSKVDDDQVDHYSKEMIQDVNDDDNDM